MTDTWNDRDDYEQSLADHHIEREEHMTPHHSIRHLLDVRAADVAKDIEHTEAALVAVTGEYDRTVATLNALRDEEQAIADARRLLTSLMLT